MSEVKRKFYHKRENVRKDYTQVSISEQPQVELDSSNIYKQKSVGKTLVEAKKIQQVL